MKDAVAHSIRRLVECAWLGVDANVSPESAFNITGPALSYCVQKAHMARRRPPPSPSGTQVPGAPKQHTDAPKRPGVLASDSSVAQARLVENSGRFRLHRGGPARNKESNTPPPLCVADCTKEAEAPQRTRIFDVSLRQLSTRFKFTYHPYRPSPPSCPASS